VQAESDLPLLVGYPRDIGFTASLQHHEFYKTVGTRTEGASGHAVGEGSAGLTELSDRDSAGGIMATMELLNLSGLFFCFNDISSEPKTDSNIPVITVASVDSTLCSGAESATNLSLPCGTHAGVDSTNPWGAEPGTADARIESTELGDQPGPSKVRKLPKRPRPSYQQSTSGDDVYSSDSSDNFVCAPAGVTSTETLRRDLLM